MNSYDTTQQIEAEHMPAVLELLSSRYPDAERLDGKKYGTTHGDIFAGGLYYEVKFEETHTGNLFLEAWSNLGTFRTGWMFNLTETHRLLYAFPIEGVMYSMDFQQLKREWFGNPAERCESMPFTPRAFYEPVLRKQGKHEQHNTTWGWCPQVSMLARHHVAMPVNRYAMRAGRWELQNRNWDGT